MASSLSIWQKSQVSEAVQLLSRAYLSIDLALSADAVDEIEDTENLKTNRDTIGSAIDKLKELL
jgi:hypothetical protein